MRRNLDATHQAEVNAMAQAINAAIAALAEKPSNNGHTADAPSTPVPGANPDTGDGGSLILWTALLSVFGIAVTGAILFGKRTR